jgi:hypothetical protein
MKLFLNIALIISAALFGYGNPLSTTHKDIKPIVNIEKTRQKATEALAFCQSKNFNADFCIFRKRRC